MKQFLNFYMVCLFCFLLSTGHPDTTGTSLHAGVGHGALNVNVYHFPILNCRRAHATRLASVPEPGRDVTHAKRVGRQIVAHANAEHRRQRQQDSRRSSSSSDRTYHVERQQVRQKSELLFFISAEYTLREQNGVQDARCKIIDRYREEQWKEEDRKKMNIKFEFNKSRRLDNSAFSVEMMNLFRKSFCRIFISILISLDPIDYLIL